MNKTSINLIAALLIIALAIGGYYWWQSQEAPQPPAPSVAPPATVEPAPEATPEEPAVKYPIESAAPPKTEPKAPPAPPEEAREWSIDEQIAASLIELFGQDAVASFLRTTDVPRRVVATVDNLGRSHAAPALWPVQPMPGRFSVVEQGEETVINPDNHERYEPFVRFVEAVDTSRAVALYVKLYPVFQEAYEAQGYPGRYFNDRVVATIDNLLQTPELEGPFAVQLTPVEDEAQRMRPWVRYRYVDPQLESLSAGQKMLLRMGSDNRARMKAKLREIRYQLVGGAAPRR